MWERVAILLGRTSWYVDCMFSLLSLQAVFSVSYAHTTVVVEELQYNDSVASGYNDISK